MTDLLAPALPAAPYAGRRNRTRAVRLLLALAAGLCLEAAFPPVGAWALAPVGCGLLAVAVRGTSVRRGALLGLVCGLALFVPLLHWTGAVAGPAAWLVLAAAEAGFLALLGGALALASRSAAWPVLAAALWVGEEAARDRLPFGGFPWGRLAFSQGGAPLAPVAALGGAPLLTCAVAALGTGVAALLVTRRRSVRVVGLLAVLLPLVGLLVPTPTGGKAVTVAVVQGNVPRLGLDAFSQRAAVLRAHVDATLALASDVRAGRVARPDVVVWPENASDLDPYTDPEAAALIDGAVRAVGVPVLVGAVTDGPGRFISNRGIVWDPVTGPGASYVKRHPVPFGEYVPLRSVLRRLSSKVDLVQHDFAAGTTPGLLQLGPVPVADVICFEVAYDGVVRDAVHAGGRLLVVQTNNATFGRSGESAQQLAMSRVRAVETGRAVVVAATSGISAVIAPDGRVQARSAVFTRQVLVERVPVRAGRTVAARLGAAPELVLSVAGLLGLGLAALREPTVSAVGRVLVVIPTYDEAENVGPITARVRTAVPDAEVLVVDDASPDGTGELADRIAAGDPQVHVLHRAGKSGLGAAYLAGFGWARERGYDVVVEMDADGSHAPEQLPRLLAALEQADLVLGSRWVEGGRVVNWPRSRELLSRGGNAYTRLALGLPLRDATGGYRAFRGTLLDELLETPVASQGYCFQVDLAWKAWLSGARVVEVPITFVERERGESKMSRAIVGEALLRVTLWGLRSRRSRRPTA